MGNPKDSDPTEAINNAIKVAHTTNDSPPPLTINSLPPTLDLLKQAGVAEAMMGLLENIINDEEQFQLFISTLTEDEQTVFATLIKRHNAGEA